MTPPEDSVVPRSRPAGKSVPVRDGGALGRCAPDAPPRPSCALLTRRLASTVDSGSRSRLIVDPATEARKRSGPRWSHTGLDPTIDRAIATSEHRQRELASINPPAPSPRLLETFAALLLLAEAV